MRNSILKYMRIRMVVIIYITLHCLIINCRAVLSAAPVSSCDNAADIVLQSPDGTREAYVGASRCETSAANTSESHWVTVGKIGSPPDQGVNVFLAWDAAPSVAWSDAEHLVIAIKEVSTIKKSIHEAIGISIIYHLTSTVSEEFFKKNIDDYERKTSSEINNRRGTFVGDPAKDLAVLNAIIARRWEDYRRFKAWALANAENSQILDERGEP